VNKALDTKERSRARKEAVESKRDKKSLALDVLKAKRKEKQELQQKKVTTVITLFIQIEIYCQLVKDLDPDFSKVRDSE
jgi:hypothetical protein